MALWECAECTTRYAVGAPKCPQCSSVVRVNEATRPPEEEQDMAKVTVHGGPSVEGFDVDPETSELTPVEEGGEDTSAGRNSSTSSEKDSSTPETSDSASPSPARTTGSRSAKGRTATQAGSAGPAGGDQAAGTSAADK